MGIQMGGQVAIVKLSARYHAKITKTLYFLVQNYKTLTFWSLDFPVLQWVLQLIIL